MKTFWSFVAGGIAVAFLCAASGVQKEWEIYSMNAGVVDLTSRADKMSFDLPAGSETIGSHIVNDGTFTNVIIIYRVPKK